MTEQSRSTHVFVLGVALALLAALILSWPMLRPPAQDLIALTRFMGLSAGASLLVGLTAWRLRLWQQARVRLSLTLGYLVAGGLTFLNVWLTAQLMFINSHDLALAEVLLVFSGLLTIAFGYLATTGVIENAARLAAAAKQIAAGDLSARVAVFGRDELAQTAAAFNAMATELETMDAKRRELDELRSDLIAWTSHDLRTPLTAIRVRTEALADGVLEDPAMVARYHQQICSEVQRLSALIDELFELAQLDAGEQVFELAPYSLGDLMSDSLESFRLQAEAKGVTLKGETEPGLDPVRMDAQKMSRLLSNLITNAIRHTPAGGQVTIRARRVGEDVVLQVADSGDGIPDSDLPRLFERFFRGERSRTRGQGGAGLGLAIARSIAEGHAGHIEVQSAIGQGAVFTVHWPG